MAYAVVNTLHGILQGEFFIGSSVLLTRDPRDPFTYVDPSDP